MISEKIRSLRKQANMSQEQLSEKLNVSRQAVTKWETGRGFPDIENIRSIAALFEISLDDLLESKAPANDQKGFLFESVTEYDIDCKKSYDIAIGGAKQSVLTGYDGEKLLIRLASNMITDIKSMFKVKIDDVKKRIDINIRRFENMTEAKAKEQLYVYIQFPSRYVKNIEFSGNTERLELTGLAAETFEYSGTAAHVVMDADIDHTEIDCNQDMKIQCRKLSGRLDINQISSSSRIYIPTGTPFVTVVKGIGNHIFYEEGGRASDDFSLHGEKAGLCENIVELNGLKSELIVIAGAEDEGKL